MNFLNQEIGDFAVKAYQAGKTVDVTKADVLGKWSIFFFYPADFPLVCPRDLEPFQSNNEAFKQAGRKFTRFLKTPNSCTRPGRKLPKRLANCNTRC